MLISDEYVTPKTNTCESISPSMFFAAKKTHGMPHAATNPAATIKRFISAFFISFRARRKMNTVSRTAPIVAAFVILIKHI